MDKDAEIIKHAAQDLQMWMANVGRETTESAVAAWQQGYIAGVQRAMSIQEISEIEDVE